MMKHALVLLSGGQDSTTCLYWAKARAETVDAVTIDYAQRHRIELNAAVQIAALARVRRYEVITAPVLESTSPLVDKTRTVAAYADADSLPGGIEQTFVPLRNALFIVIAANRAVAWGCDTLVLGVSAEDFGGYPDCRQVFLNGMYGALARALDGAAMPPVIMAPLMRMTKKQTVLLATELPGCMEALMHTHTCYNGVRPPCGKCHACLLRRRGFEQAGIPDPLLTAIS